MYLYDSQSEETMSILNVKRNGITLKASFRNSSDLLDSWEGALFKILSTQI